MNVGVVDSCVLLDIFTEDPVWFEWSSNVLTNMSEKGQLVINPAIYAELSARFETIEELECVLPDGLIEYCPISREATFLAGKCFMQYKRRGGSRTSPLPDFFIGAHAAVENLPLITRDTARFRTYFPTIELIHP